MSDTTCHMSISLDGFVAGPDQSRDNPLGKRGKELHGWHIGDPRANDDDQVANSWLMRPRGAYVMGRNMFGPIRGPWDEEWTGWWGPEPPYHAPVFVLTHHDHEPIQMEGGTTFHFVTDGFDAAYSAEMKVLEPRLDIKPIAIQATLDEIAKTDTRAKQVKAEQLIDRRFLEEMEKDGTFDRLGFAR